LDSPVNGIRAMDRLVERERGEREREREMEREREREREILEWMKLVMWMSHI